MIKTYGLSKAIHTNVASRCADIAERLGEEANELLVQLEVLLEIYVVTIFK